MKTRIYTLVEKTRHDDPANTLGDAFVVERWAAEGLAILEDNIQAINLVHRDFEEEIQEHGDTVNVSLPASLTSTRKAKTTDVVPQALTAEKIPVKLDQQLYTSFMIRDRDLSLSFQDLVGVYLTPAMQSIALQAEQVVLGEMYNFIPNTPVGKFGTALTAGSVTSMQDQFNQLRLPQQNRHVILTSGMQKDLLDVELFVSSEKIGDKGTALRRGSLGELYGLNFHYSSVAPNVAAGNTTVAGAVNYSSGYALGTTVLTVDGFSAEIQTGALCTIGGDMTPQMITAVTGGSTPTQLTISPGLRSAVANDAVITVYTPGTVNLVAGYASGWEEAITVADFSVSPKNMQMLSIGPAALDAYTDAKQYACLPTVSQPTTTSIMTNRCLDAALTNDDVVALGPAGQYGFAFNRDAVAFVSRPLTDRLNGMGAWMSTVNYKGLSIRVTMQYEGRGQGLLVTADMLCGVKTLDDSRGFLVYR